MPKMMAPSLELSSRDTTLPMLSPLRAVSDLLIKEWVLDDKQPENERTGTGGVLLRL